LASRLPASAVVAQGTDQAQAVVDLVERRPLYLPDSDGRTRLLRSKPAGVADGQLESTHRWVQHRDLLSSDRTARVFAVETEDDGYAYLRFGFGGLGQGLAANATLVATYRVGNGTPGNVGRHAIAHLVSDDDTLAVMEVRNPLPVTSGIDAEPIEVARLAAPYAFQVPLSCITPDDYAAAALQLPNGRVRQARARIERTGNWQTVFVYAQRADGQPLDAGFHQQLLAWLQPRALSGYQVAVRPPRPVGLDLQLRAWAVPHRFPSAVHRAVQLALGNGWQENGQPGFFYPANLAMGQPIYWSQVIRAVMAVDGVARAEIVRFGRLDDTRALDPVPIDELEVARLDADPDHPEYGTLQIDMVGTP
jgi:predicted phage baseplate assembly protein